MGFQSTCVRIDTHSNPHTHKAPKACKTHRGHSPAEAVHDRRLAHVGPPDHRHHRQLHWLGLPTPPTTTLLVFSRRRRHCGRRPTLVVIHQLQPPVVVPKEVQLPLQHREVGGVKHVPLLLLLVAVLKLPILKLIIRPKLHRRRLVPVVTRGGSGAGRGLRPPARGHGGGGGRLAGAALWRLFGFGGLDGLINQHKHSDVSIPPMRVDRMYLLLPRLVRPSPPAALAAASASSAPLARLGAQGQAPAGAARPARQRARLLLSMLGRRRSISIAARSIRACDPPAAHHPPFSDAHTYAP